MNGSRQRYRLDDYLQDKAQRAASPLARAGSSSLRQGMAVTPTGNASVGTVKPLPVKPPHTVQRPSGSSYNASNAGVGQDVTVDTFKPDAGGGAGGGVLTQSQMTTAYTKQLMENALSNLLAMQNRKFKYDAHSSPLYSIVQKQAEENARLASGRAYAQAKAATGGYGSSYATLAADEAGRQAMRELDDQQLALYEAARSEFEAENASALDWYNTTKQLYEDAYVLEQDAKANAPATMTLDDGSTVEVTDAARELYAGYLDSFTQGTGYDTLKTAMINGGASEADADQAIAMFKRMKGATIADKISAFEKNPTTSDAAGIMDDAKASGTWDQVQPKVSAGLSDAYLKALDDLDGGYSLLGYDAEAWSGLSEEEKATAILQAGGEAVKSGVMSEADFAKLISKDAKTAIIEIGNSDDRPIAKSRAVFNAISGILVCVENGTLSKEAADQIIADMAGSSVVKTAYEKHAKYLNSFANDKEAKKKLGIEAMPDGFLRLDDAQEEALRVLDRIYKQY